MSEKKTGLGHDDDGNVDDRRIAGWVIIGTALAISVADLFALFTANQAIVNTMFLAGVGLLGSTVAEKFGSGRGPNV